MYVFLPVDASDSPRHQLLFKSKEELPKISIDQFIEKLTPEILDKVFDYEFQRDFKTDIHVEFPKISFDHSLSLIPVIIMQLYFCVYIQ